MIKKIAGFVLFLGIIACVFFSWWKQTVLPVDPMNKESYIFVIPQGMGSGDIAKKLKKADLIKNVLAFQAIITKQGVSNKLQAGDFRLSPSMSLFVIADALTHGTLDIWITIPEGLRKEEIADRIADAFVKYNADFNADLFLAETEDLEGCLFPDTYLIPKNASSSSIIKILNNTFEKKFQSLANKTSMTKKELVILASLIEREVKTEKDRNIVAGILIKRLKKDWALQIDATTQYSQGTEKKWWPIVKPEDLKIDSPYNTYLNKNLPPTPICNPGLTSLNAAVNPQTSRYWFYLSDNSGKIHYAETLEEHNENIRKYLD